MNVHTADGLPAMPGDRFIDSEGPLPRARPEIDHDAAKLARAIRDRTVEDLADHRPRARGARLDAKDWTRDTSDHVGSAEWCAMALGMGRAAFVADVWRRVAERTAAKRDHRADIDEAHRGEQCGLGLGDRPSRAAHVMGAALIAVAMRGEWS